MKKITSIFLVVFLVLTNFQGWEVLKQFNLFGKFGLFQGIEDSFASTKQLVGGEDTSKIVVSSEEEKTTESGLKYIKNGSNVIITSYTGTSKEIEIPPEIDDGKVTSIAKGAFKYSGIEAIDLPYSIISIETEAFYGCPLKKIVLPSNLESLGYNVFNSSYITDIKIPKTIKNSGVRIENGFAQVGAFSECKNLKNIEFEDGIKTIPNYILYNCYSVKTVKIPSGVTSIENYSFYQCINIQNIILPNSLINIGISAFEGCEKLENIKIPESVVIIQDNAFSGCTSFTNIELPQKLTSVSKGLFLLCYNLQTVTIPEGVTIIENNAFESCESLANIVLPHSIITIGKEAFFQSGLESISLPDNIKSIGVRAFKECPLTSIKLPKDLKKIEAETFSNTKIESVNLPNALENIEEDAFYYCTNLKNIDIPNGVKKIGTRAFLGCPLDKIVLPSNLESLGYDVFDSEYITSVKIPKNILTIESETRYYEGYYKGTSAFSQCKNLKKVEFEEGLEKIPSYALYFCKSVNEIIIPESTVIIGNQAFEGCCMVNDIILPTNLEEIGSKAFSQCGIRKILIPKSVNKIYYDIFGEEMDESEIYIQGYKGSYAEKYANEHSFIFIDITNVDFELPLVENFKVLRRSDTSLVLSWDKLDEMDGYEVYKASSKNDKYIKVRTILDNNILTSTSTGLKTSQRYYYRIRGFKEVNGEKVYTYYTTLDAVTNPIKPTGIKVINATENALRIGWDKVEGATGYEVFRATSENGKYVRVKTIENNNITQNASPYLQSGKTYYYRVKAYLVVDGEKLYSNSATLQAKTKSFGAITGLKMVASTENSIRISWNCVNDVEGYEVFRSTSEDGKYVKVKTITDNSITSTASPNLESSTTYYYKVRSYKTIDGNKQYGDFSIAKAYTKPSVVNNLKLIDITTKGIEIGWDEVKGADGYEVFRSKGNDYIKVGTTSNLKYISSNITKGDVYTYKVKAYKLIGKSKVYGIYSDILKVEVN